jgi:hypothetical protein
LIKLVEEFHSYGFVFERIEDSFPEILWLWRSGVVVGDEASWGDFAKH